LESWELERELRKSSMGYSLKITLYLYGVSQNPCPNCSFKNEYRPVPLNEKDKKCFQRCEFKICLWILSPEQLILYEKFRPAEKKKEDIEMAIRENKIVFVDQILRESQKISPSFYKKL